MAANWIKKGYKAFVFSSKFVAPFLLLVLRLYFGWLLVVTGFGKWMNIHAVGEFFASLSLPYPLLSAYMVATFEVLGGLALVLGLFSRFFGLILSCVFIVAYLTAHKEAVAALGTSPSLFVQQEPFLYLLTALLVYSFGPGLFSIDYWLEKKHFGKAF